MVQHVGSVVEMQRGETGITFPQGAGGFIQTAEQRSCILTENRNIVRMIKAPRQK